MLCWTCGCWYTSAQFSDKHKQSWRLLFIALPQFRCNNVFRYICTYLSVCWFKYIKQYVHHFGLTLLRKLKMSETCQSVMVKLTMHHFISIDKLFLIIPYLRSSLNLCFLKSIFWDIWVICAFFLVLSTCFGLKCMYPVPWHVCGWCPQVRTGVPLPDSPSLKYTLTLINTRISFKQNYFRGKPEFDTRMVEYASQITFVQKFAYSWLFKLIFFHNAYH